MKLACLSSENTSAIVNDDSSALLNFGDYFLFLLIIHELNDNKFSFNKQNNSAHTSHFFSEEIKKLKSDFIALNGDYIYN